MNKKTMLLNSYINVRNFILLFAIFSIAFFIFCDNVHAEEWNQVRIVSAHSSNGSGFYSYSLSGNNVYNIQVDSDHIVMGTDSYAKFLVLNSCNLYAESLTINTISNSFGYVSYQGANIYMTNTGCSFNLNGTVYRGKYAYWVYPIQSSYFSDHDNTYNLNFNTTVYVSNDTGIYFIDAYVYGAIPDEIKAAAESYASIQNDNANTNNIINNQNSNTNSIINNQNSNSQNEINNANQNKQDIINNQNANTQEQIESQQVCSFIDKSSVKTSGKYLGATGTEYASSVTGITDFISLDKNTSLKLLDNGDYLTYLCFYNINKVVISCNRLDSLVIGSFLSIPNNASYFRSTIYSAFNKPLFQICKNGNQATNDKLDDIQNADIDDEYKQAPDSSDYDTYSSAESDLKNMVGQTDLSNLSINSDISTTTWIWDTLSSLIHSHTLIFSMFISILSIGIIKLALGR